MLVSVEGPAPSGTSPAWPSSPWATQTWPVVARSTVRCGPSAVPSFSMVYGTEETPSASFSQANAPYASRPVNPAAESPDFSCQPS